MSLTPPRSLPTGLATLSDGPGGHRIAEVERDTGIGKDTLRVWERRYGFPAPVRDAQGERLYDEAQVQRLRLVRRLLDAGHRPAQVVPLALADLQSLLQTPPTPRRGPGRPPRQAVPAAQPSLAPHWLAEVQAHRLDVLRRQLHQHMLQHGLVNTLESVISPLAGEVGAAWARGELSVYQEHLFTEAVESLLREAIAGLAPAGGRSTGRPRVLLTTLPGELHTLGLLMAEAVLAMQGCERLSLGPNTPIDEIVAAAVRLEVQVVALGSSAHATPKALREDLQRLRAALPPEVPVWLGGASPRALGRAGVPGVTTLSRVSELLGLVQAWQAAAR